MIFKDKKCVSISIPKTGTKKRYCHINGGDYNKDFSQINANTGRLGYIQDTRTYNFFTHGHFSVIQWKDYLKENPEYKDYFTFSFVRNPYKRFYDMWFARSGSVRRKVGHKGWQPAINNLLKEYGTQSQFLLDEHGKIAVDFLGKLENYKSDYKKIQRKCKDLPNFSKKLEIYNDKTCLLKDLYIKEMNEEQLKEIIYDYYEDDFINFGYKK